MVWCKVPMDMDMRGSHGCVCVVLAALQQGCFLMMVLLWQILLSIGVWLVLFNIWPLLVQTLLLVFTSSTNSWVVLPQLIWKLPSVFWDMLGGPWLMALVLSQVHWPSLHFLMQIGQGNQLIVAPPLAYLCFLALVLFHGLPRSKT